jgi:hypothetical protein
MIREDYLIFLQDKDWYYWDEKEWKFKLTSKAPPMAIISYNEYYSYLINFTK